MHEVCVATELHVTLQLLCRCFPPPKPSHVQVLPCIHTHLSVVLLLGRFCLRGANDCQLQTTATTAGPGICAAL